MNQDAVNNRLLVMMAGVIVSPWLDQRFGIKLTPVDTAGLIVLGFHALAAGWKKAVAAFVLYFPPPNPQQPVAPAQSKVTP